MPSTKWVGMNSENFYRKEYNGWTHYEDQLWESFYLLFSMWGFTDQFVDWTGVGQSLKSYMDILPFYKILESTLGFETLVDGFYFCLLFTTKTIDRRSNSHAKCEQTRSITISVCNENFGKTSGTTRRRWRENVSRESDAPSGGVLKLFWIEGARDLTFVF